MQLIIQQAHIFTPHPAAFLRNRVRFFLPNQKKMRIFASYSATAGKTCFKHNILINNILKNEPF